ncbi:hypothetical protein PICSAR70_04558 [Mycobacterium avium subsp. paratuberculosis]|nr:hypothetical protein PICSAR70_04558 [Mycobacterium avium subsp. paratuberculosis]
MLLRLDERRRLLGQPPLGPALLTADARAAGLPLPAGAGADGPSVLAGAASTESPVGSGL